MDEKQNYCDDVIKTTACNCACSLTEITDNVEVLAKGLEAIGFGVEDVIELEDQIAALSDLLSTTKPFETEKLMAIAEEIRELSIKGKVHMPDPTINEDKGV